MYALMERCASARSLKVLSLCFLSTSLTMPCTTLHCASTASGLTESQCVATRSTAAPGTAACRASRGSTTSRWKSRAASRIFSPSSVAYTRSWWYCILVRGHTSSRSYPSQVSKGIASRHTSMYTVLGCVKHGLYVSKSQSHATNSHFSSSRKWLHMRMSSLAPRCRSARSASSWATPACSWCACAAAARRASADCAMMSLSAISLSSPVRFSSPLSASVSLSSKLPDLVESSPLRVCDPLGPLVCDLPGPPRSMWEPLGCALYPPMPFLLWRARRSVDRPLSSCPMSTSLIWCCMAYCPRCTRLSSCR
mmetsp:Transcript_363/g.897  ORF Transcript_363/g.897 Transcript_363/m.897 type:complete len:309 (-) Transcript_363:1042-1968(-)